MIKEAHDNAIEKGFYPEGENKNIGELLMLIVSELGEALEAHRCGRFIPKELDTSYFYNTFEKDGIKHSYMITFFEGYIKDTFEDEIADTFIRLFDLCEYLEIDIEKHITAKMAYNKTRAHKHGKEY